MTIASKMSGKNKRNRMRLLFSIQGGICPYCGLKMACPDEMRARGLMLRADAPSLDHLKPRSRGGVNALTNLLLVHKDCNERRDTGAVPNWKLVQEITERVRNYVPTNEASPKLRAETYGGEGRA